MKNPFKTWEPSAPNCPVVEVPGWRIHDLLFMPGPVKSSDVAEAYIGDKLSRQDGPPVQVSQFVLHNGLRYVNVGGSEAECTLFELVPVAGHRPPPLKKYSCTGIRVLHAGKPHFLGRPIKFRALPRTVDEARWHLRQMFAHGGHFSAKHADYSAFLLEWRKGREFRDAVDENEAAAIKEELGTARRSLPKDREGMRKLCLTDPLWLDKPWARKPVPVKRPTFEMTTAEDFLSEILERA